MLSKLGKIFSRQHFEIVFLFFQENRLWYFMQIVFLGEYLHEISKPVCWTNYKNIINFSSAEIAQRVVKVNLKIQECAHRFISGTILVAAGLGDSVGCASDWWSVGCGFDPCQVGNILSWRLIMKYFLQSFCPFSWIKKGSCQFLVQECAQYWLTT